MDAERQDPDPVETIEHALAALRRPGPWGPRGSGRRGPGFAAHHADEHAEGQQTHGRPGHLRGAGRGWGPGFEHPLQRAARHRLVEALAARPDGASISELAEAIGVDQPRASRVVADVVDRGLAVRTHDPRDARRSLVSLTASGRAHLEQQRAARRSAVERGLEGFTADEREQLAALLARFAEGWHTG